MVQRARSGRQLAIELPPELLQRLKAQAAAEERPVAALVRRWIDAGLNGALETGVVAPAAVAGDLVERLEALEAAVAALQQSRPARTPKPAPAASLPLELHPPDEGSGEPRKGEPAIPPLGEVPAGAITTADLAARIGMKRGSLNERLRRAGGARIGLEMEGWRCVGHHFPEGGGPPRWLWESA
jgi:predicted DNA-binding protein